MSVHVSNTPITCQARGFHAGELVLLQKTRSGALRWKKRFASREESDSGLRPVVTREVSVQSKTESLILHYI